jgi:hypothetical protein
MSAFIYLKTDTIRYQEKEVYYRKPINTELHQATEYNDHYEYYYKQTVGNGQLVPLGKYVGLRKYRSDTYFDDHDYPIIVFDKDFVYETKKQNIYCKGIPDSDENKILIDNMDYEGFPVYYQR